MVRYCPPHSNSCVVQGVNAGCEVLPTRWCCQIWRSLHSLSRSPWVWKLRERRTGGSWIYHLFTSSRDRLHHMGPPQCFIYDFIDAIGSQGFLVFWGMDCYHAWPALFLHVVRPVADSTLTRWLPKIGVAFLLPRDELRGL